MSRSHTNNPIQAKIATGGQLPYNGLRLFQDTVQNAYHLITCECGNAWQRARNAGGTWTPVKVPLAGANGINYYEQALVNTVYKTIPANVDSWQLIPLLNLTEKVTPPTSEQHVKFELVDPDTGTRQTLAHYYPSTASGTDVIGTGVQQQFKTGTLDPIFQVSAGTVGGVEIVLTSDYDGTYQTGVAGSSSFWSGCMFYSLMFY